MSFNNLDESTQDATEAKPVNQHAETVIKKLQSKIDKALGRDKAQHKNYKKWRDLVTLKDISKANNDVKPHLIQSTMAALIPALYAKNPEIEIRTTHTALASPQAKVWQEMAASAEALIQQEFIERCHLKAKAKAMLRSTLTNGHGWLMVTWQDDYKRDPVQVTREEDAQDNVAALKSVSQQLDDGQGDVDYLKAQLHLQTEHVQAALDGKRELYVERGLVIDRIAPEDLIVLDDSVTELPDYLQASAIARRIYMSKAWYREKFGKDAPETASSYTTRDSERKTGECSDSDLICMYEVWEKATGKVFTFADGAREYAREPFVPFPSAKRFYPFFGLFFNIVDGQYFPMSDVELLEDLQHEYHMLRSQQNHARAKNVPTYVVSTQGDLNAQDATALVKPLNHMPSNDAEWVAIDIPSGTPISQHLQQFPMPQYNTQLWDPSQNARDVEMMTRSGDAARGFVNKAKTATEAEIMSMGMQSGIAERQDMLEDVMADMARFALQHMLQAFTAEDVVIALGNAETHWQPVGIDVAFQNLNLDIKAGSMSKPNKFQEREQWMQLMPLIQQTMQQIAQFKQQGMDDMAQATRKLLEELINRFDERIDLDEFLPDMTPNPMQQVMQQLGGMMGDEPSGMPADDMAVQQNQMMGANYE